MLTVVAFFAACQKNTNTSDVITGSNGTSKGSIAKKDAQVGQLNDENGISMSGFGGVFLPKTGVSNFGSNYGIIATLPLYAGFNTTSINIGTVTVANDDDYVYVTYNITAPDWKIKKLHMFIGPIDSLPSNPNNGNLQPGHFPNIITFKKVTVTNYSFCIPTSELEECFAFSARATVKKVTNCGSSDPEFAWADGVQLPVRCGVGFYTTELCKQGTPPPPPPGVVANQSTNN